MSWFDEQIKYRKQMDDEDFLNSLQDVAQAITGKKHRETLNNKELTDSAIDEIIHYFGYRIKNVEVPANVDTLEQQIAFRMRPYGVLTRNVKLTKGWYKDAFGPLITTYKKDGRVVALVPSKFAGYVFLDEEKGNKVKVKANNEDLFEEEAICFYKPLPLRSLTIKDLLLFMIEQMNGSDVVLYLGFMLLSTLIGMIPPIFTKWLFGYVLESGSVSILVSLACFIICFSLSQQLFETFKTLSSSKIGIKQDVAVEAAVMGRILSLPASFFKEYSSGEMNQRSAYIQALCTTLFDAIGTTGLTSIFSLIYIGQVFVFARSLVWPSIFITLATLLFSLIVTFAQMNITKKQMEIGAKTSGLTYSTITGIQKIKLAGAEKRMFSRFAKQYAKEAELLYNPPTFIKLSNVISSAIAMFGTVLLYYFAVVTKVSVADYYAFNASYGMVSSAFMSIASIATTLATIKPALEMAKPIMETAPEISDGNDIVTNVRGEIEFNHVSFRYSDDTPNIIDDLSLTIKPNEYVAIVGGTGCGKTTLLRLLLGFEKPQKGTIFYDKKDASKIDMRSLRNKMIGVVMQDGKLFLGDIFSNITLSAPNCTMDDAWEAAEIASIAEDIRNMPMGMHTLISEGQGGISGGQKQRIMIARAVATKPKILMFDEATSALDNITQKSVSNAIDKLKCTRIVIAHRLSTIRNADRIIYLEKGKIVEEGTYEELVAKNGYFASLIERQRIDADVD